MNQSALSCRLIGMLFLFTGALSLNAQTYETDFGWPDSEENSWDCTESFQGRAVTLTNTNQSGGRTLLLATHDPLTGNVIGSTNLFKSNSSLYGRSLGAWPSPGAPRFYHITGFNRPSLKFNSQAFLIRTLPNHVPTHYLRKVSTGRTEQGMVVEELKFRTLVAGNSSPLTTLPAPAPVPGPSTAYFWAARFDVNMNVQWAFNYPAIDTAGYSFAVQEGCTGSYLKSPVGAAPLPGLVLTGYYWKQGQPWRHAFVSMIDFASGEEIWRTPCPSDWRIDEGLDIVYYPEGRLYFIVGYAYKGDGSRQLFTAAVSDNGTFLGSTVHSVPSEFKAFDMVARDVCLSLDDKRAVIAGYVQISGATAPQAKTFTAQLTMEPVPAVDWVRYYEESRSDPAGSEAIQRFRNAPANQPGYLLSTGGSLYHNAPVSMDAQVLRVLPDGSLGELRCEAPRIALNPIRQQPRLPVFRFRRLAFRWIKEAISYENVRTEDSPCEN